MNKCRWRDKNELLTKYHDQEWGVPVLDSRELFASFALEIFQAGLNWETILQRRPAFMTQFNEFEPECVAQIKAKDVDQILQNTQIIRNRRKISAVCANAKIVVALDMSFSDYIWHFFDFEPLQATVASDAASSRRELLNRVTQQMKGAGFTFIGPKLLNSFFQAAGLINDHDVSCFRYRQVAVL
ncbi:DNA-3-methyladenine glycosylase I [Pediococcus siamensis]|uniref:DNA-3-methyladenine glycosylase I n=1 Tax=Pediococcus siamensis TaxID=381829 RepID=UPI0039A3DA54